MKGCSLVPGLPKTYLTSSATNCSSRACLPVISIMVSSGQGSEEPGQAGRAPVCVW
jgi:hypothetical protein